MADETETDEKKWQLVGTGRLNLVGTRIEIVYIPRSIGPYHVHHDGNCHGMTDRVEIAKHLAFLVLKELLELGIDP